jgi:predicted glycosyltransferase
LLFDTPAANISFKNVTPFTNDIVRPAIIGTCSLTHHQCQNIGQLFDRCSSIQRSFEMLKYTWF